MRLIQGCVSSAAARRETRDREFKTKNENQIVNLFIKPKTKLQQAIHPRRTQNKAPLIDADSLHGCAVLMLRCTILHQQVFLLRSSPSFQGPPARMNTQFFFLFKRRHFQMLS